MTIKTASATNLQTEPKSRSGECRFLLFTYIRYYPSSSLAGTTEMRKYQVENRIDTEEQDAYQADCASHSIIHSSYLLHHIGSDNVRRTSGSPCGHRLDQLREVEDPDHAQQHGKYQHGTNVRKGDLDLQLP